MSVEICTAPVAFRLYGLKGLVNGRSYGEVGFALMNAMWETIKQSQFPHRGVNHWVYLPDDRMFVGVETSVDDEPPLPNRFEMLELSLARHARYLHVGPYEALP
ncbi:MAG: GyrI-like domain-containing protein, partial [Planctomycetales bacterium]|nr:GyrI-like domain-containing protein [Planctomycetales bacterium]